MGALEFDNDDCAMATLPAEACLRYGDDHHHD